MVLVGMSNYGAVIAAPAGGGGEGGRDQASTLPISTLPASPPPSPAHCSLPSPRCSKQLNPPRTDEAMEGGERWGCKRSARPYEPTTLQGGRLPRAKRGKKLDFSFLISPSLSKAAKGEKHLSFRMTVKEIEAAAGDAESRGR